MRRFEGLSDEELAEKIVRVEAAIEAAAIGGGVGKVQGEGRMVEYTRGNVAGAEKMLDELLFERSQRPTLNNGAAAAGRALPVRFFR